ncbi:MAG: hypothetical protein Q8R92_20945 [Deltaproteobacteria bacterium]|nr:hypothetical protein [Deltaproteobacteria bacterium]
MGCRKAYQTAGRPGTFVERRGDQDVFEVRSGPRVYLGSVDERTVKVGVGDVVLFSPDADADRLADGVLVVVSRRMPHTGTRQILVVEGRALPGGTWQYLPCAEGFAPLLSTDPAVELVGVVVEVRRAFR